MVVSSAFVVPSAVVVLLSWLSSTLVIPLALVFNTIGIWHSLRFASGYVSLFVVSNLIFVVTFFESFFASEFQALCIGCGTPVVVQ